jgi:hypothetical protein
MMRLRVRVEELRSDIDAVVEFMSFIFRVLRMQQVGVKFSRIQTSDEPFGDKVC